MSTHQVYTPKAIMLMTKIKRYLATQGISGSLHGWDYTQLCSLCDQLNDTEMQGCLQLLHDEIHHSAEPNAWAM